MAKLGAVIPKESRKALQKFKAKVKKENPTPLDKWEQVIMIDKSLLHNLYINVLLGYYGEAGNINVVEMIDDRRSAFSPFERNRLWDRDWETMI